MTSDIIMYIAVIVIGALVVLSFVMGLEKMIRVILGNYVVGGVCLAASQSIKLFLDYLVQNPDITFVGMSAKGLTAFLTNGQATIILILYALLMFLIYKKSTINIRIPTDEVIKKSLYLVVVPLTVLSVILAIQICLIGVDVITPASIQAATLGFANNIYVQGFLGLTPVWILIHGITTIIVTSELKISIKTDM